jgi:parvulin-like peptidyl-prolyl isomerase
MEKVFFSMTVPGRVSPIIQTKYGYHIFLLVERTAAKRESLDMVKDRIAGQLRELKQKEALAEKLKLLREEMPVRLFPENLDFSYNSPEKLGGPLK